MSPERRQWVRFLFLRVDPVWRRIDPTVQRSQKQRFGQALREFRGRVLLRTYSLMGTRGDCDLLLWQVAEDVETLQAVETAMFSTALGGYLMIAQSYLGLTKRSEYEFPELSATNRTTMQPSDARYLFVYPFVKRREWYQLPFEEREGMMRDHVRIGREHPSIRINTMYSFGLDDQEFVVVFEADDPAEFLDLVMELRCSPASAYTERDTPVFTCIQMSLWDALDALGGAPSEDPVGLIPADVDGYTAVAATAELPPGTSKRVYVDTEAVALYNVDGTYYAVSDRCTHGRASLSEGSVDSGSCVLECPWHGGRFDLKTGQPLAGPPQVAVKTFDVKVDGDHILVR